MEQTNYIIRGGTEGTERLRLLSRVMRATTSSLLDRVGIRPGMECLEVGCGSGDVAFDLARRVGPQGRVVATDIDQIKLELASREAGVQQLSNIEFRLSDITQDNHAQEFDLVHARFILTHLPNPERALTKMRQALRPGGVVVIEDIDFRGYFCHPDSPALWRYVDLYTQAVQRRGGDANIGPRLPALLQDAGFETVQMNIVQPAGSTGEIKLMSAITMENIAGAVIAEGLATQGEIDEIVTELYEYASTFGTLSSTPRIVEAWGYQSCSDSTRSV
jgi:ubiquinone/menaquinone biosynthesis C-methylase UbiE